MSFGALLRNAQGSSVLNDKEVPVLYWGKKSASLPAYAGGNGTVYVDLFNIPSNVPIVVFTLVRNSSSNDAAIANAPAWVDSSGARHRLTVMNRSFINDGSNARTAATIDIYVFIPAKNIDLPDFGLAIYDASGNVVFHSGRPPLSIYGIVPGNPDEGITTISQKVAAMAQVITTAYLINSTNVGFENWEGITSYTGVMRHTTTSGYSVGTHRKTIVEQGASYISSAIYTDDPTSKFAVAYIDASYYDQFPNLPNWV